MNELETMKQALMAAAQSQIGNLENVSAEELGEVIDMIKDLEEAMYYCSKKEAAEKKSEAAIATSEMYFTPNQQRILPPTYPSYYREDYMTGRRGYDGGPSGGGNNGGGGGRSSYTYTSQPIPISAPSRDYREGRSGMSRRNYMESKENHNNQQMQTQELERYLSELSQDITEMISDSSPDDKRLLQQKLNALTAKIANV